MVYGGEERVWTFFFLAGGLWNGILVVLGLCGFFCGFRPFSYLERGAGILPFFGVEMGVQEELKCIEMGEFLY